MLVLFDLIPFSIQVQLGTNHKIKTTINQGSEQVYAESYNCFSVHAYTYSMHQPTQLPRNGVKQM